MRCQAGDDGDLAQDSFLEREDDGGRETDGGKERVGAAVVPHRNPPPILDAVEHGFDLVALFVEWFAVAALLLTEGEAVSL